MGEGILKESVPEAHTDYVIAVISEEYGSLVSIMILIIFLYISFRIIKSCFNQDNQFFENFIKRFSNIINISNFHTRRSEHKFITHNWYDFTLFKLWRIIFDWKCSFSWASFKLYKE